MKTQYQVYKGNKPFTGLLASAGNAYRVALELKRYPTSQSVKVWQVSDFLGLSQWQCLLIA